MLVSRLFSLTMRLDWFDDDFYLPSNFHVLLVLNQCLILQGTVIHGSSTKRMLEFFQTKLTEGSTVKISQFDVEENLISKWHRAKIDHPCKLLMNCGSNVVNCRSDQNILTNGIKLVPFGEITSRDPGLFIGQLNFFK